MRRNMYLLPATLAAAGLASAMLAGCSSSGTAVSTPTAVVTVTEEESVSAPPPATSAQPASSAPAATSEAPPATQTPSQPTPPKGATKLASSDEGGVSYAHYSIEGSTPEQVVKDYENQAKADGYSIINSGGGGGGWGKYGGSNYGMEAEKASAYLAVQAGGRTGGKTFFEVCSGSSKAAVEQCQQHSQNQNG